MNEDFEPEWVERNESLGWCPCGSLRSVDCECDPIYRACARQGKVIVLLRQETPLP